MLNGVGEMMGEILFFSFVNFKRFSPQDLICRLMGEVSQLVGASARFTEH